MTRLAVIDTNVLFAGLRSSQGMSHQLLRALASGAFAPALSVPLVLEYESVLLRSGSDLGLTHTDIREVIDFLCHVGQNQEIFYLWRPLLRDPQDDMVLEVAVAAGGCPIVTFNVRDFRGAEGFGVSVLTPHQFFATLEVDR